MLIKSLNTSAAWKQSRAEEPGLRLWKLGLCPHQGFPRAGLGISALKWAGIPCPGSSQGGQPDWTGIPRAAPGRSCLHKGKSKISWDSALMNSGGFGHYSWEYLIAFKSSCQPRPRWLSEQRVPRVHTQFDFKNQTSPTQPCPALALNPLPFCTQRKNSGVLLITFLSLISLHLVSS